ncbi:hypothetical protein E1287_10065 [Actinomadura sp. KC06]|uniref:DUF4097 family beta strand repeat-containing protein n=1 Tax=Actinomadura sp. KC06 TaxID=2530369 RepID=UPI0010458376|nr:DUF4097 family beta strand repeat-containing protein [Actinomadura sp. KC06]TDD36856.1 hypothetical protein E1287_10065 [Actinomadura sp. KC06]
MRTLTITAVVTAAAAATLTGCGNLTFGTHQEDRSYSAPAGITALKIKSNGNRMVLTASDSPAVKVRERLRWSNDKNKPEARHTVEGDTLSLSSKCARATIGYTNCGVSYRVEVPRNMPVEVDNADGAVVASGLSGAVKLHSDNGSLKVTDLRATSASISSNDGSIHVTGRAATAVLRSDNGSINATGLTTDRLTARTDDGRIELSGRATVAEVGTANGSIDAGGLTTDRITAETSNGGIDLRLVTPPASVRAISDNGSVHVRVPTSEGYAISMSSSNGGERIDSAVRQDSGSRHQLQLRSGNGSITVSPA